MAYIITFATFAVLAYLLRRRLGLALVVAILSSLLLSWWGKDLAGLILLIGIGYQANRLQAIVELVLLAVVLIGFIYISNSSAKGRTSRIIESLIFASTLVAIVAANLAVLLPVDGLAGQINQFIAQNNRYLLTVGGIYGLFELFRTRD